MKVVVEAKKNDKLLTFSIIPYEHALAQQWVREIKSLNEEEVQVLEKERIYSLNSEWNEETILEELKQCYITINKWRPIFGSIDFDSADQDFMNQLHLYFEQMVGLDKARTNVLHEAPEEVSKAIVNFNILIHRYECFTRHKSMDNYGRIVVTFEKKNKSPIKDEDFSLFTYEYQAGEVTLNYCHVGKPLLDFIYDEDQYVSQENILPQHKWCADFIIFFTRGTAFRKDYKEKVESFWQKYEDQMNKIGFFRDDPKLAFGRLPVGRLEEPPQELRKRIFGITEITRVFVED